MRDKNQDYEKRVSSQVECEEMRLMKKRYWKLILYILQIILVMYISSMIIDPILAVIIGVLMGTIITMVITIFERIKKEKKVKIQDIIDFVATILKGLPFVRDIPIELKQIIKSPYDRVKISKMKKYLYLIHKFIKTKNFKRSGKYSKDDAIKNLKEIKKSAEKYNFTDIFDETKFLLTSTK